MSSRMRTCRLLPIVVLLCGFAIPAASQQGPAAAPGGTAAAGANTTTARLGTSIYAGYGDPQVILVPTGGRRSTEVGADIDLLAHRRRASSDFQFAAFSGLRRYAGSDFWSHSAKAVLWAAPTARTFVGLNGTAGYTQLLSLVPNSQSNAALAAGGPSQAFNLSIAPRTTGSFSGGAQLGHDLSTRSSVVLAYDARHTRSGSGIKTRTLDQYAQFGFANRFRQRASFRISYGYRDAEYETGARRQMMRQHGLTVEFDRQWVHSPTRQTALRLSAGPSAVFGTGPSRYVGMAGVSLDGKFSRNWTCSAGAAREVSFIDGIAHPFLSDVFRGQASGQLSRTIALTVTATSSTGTSPFNVDRASYKWRGGNARLEWASSRTTSLFGEYLYRWYTVSNLPLGAGSAGRPSLGSFRVGLTWIVPVKR